MSTNPIDVIAAAIANPDSVAPRNGYKESDAAWTARVVRYVLTDEQTVAAAVAALKADGWEETHEGPLGIGTLSDDDLRNIALAVLRSVGGQ